MADKMATRAAYGKALVEMGAENPNLVVMDADLSKSTMTAEFSKTYPDRFFNMGIAEGNLEMLFVDDNYRGIGIGKRLITYAIGNLQVTKVDVNEQNIQAVGFYKYMGFSIYKRSNLDGEGKEYPILHMRL